MATLQAAALTSLETALQALTEINFDFQLAQMHVHRLGLGNLIHSQDKSDPVGDVTGTRLRGLVRLTLRAGNRQTVLNESSALVKDILGTATAALRKAGFLNLNLDSLDRLQETEPPNPQFEQAVLVSIDYEFILQPESADHVIDMLDHEMSFDEETEAFQIT